MKIFSVFLLILALFVNLENAMADGLLLNNSTSAAGIVQFDLNQAALGTAQMIEEIEQYYDKNNTLPPKNAFQQCFPAPSPISCIENDEDGGVFVFFSANTGILSKKVIHTLISKDENGKPNFGSTLRVTDIGFGANTGTGPMNPFPPFTRSPAVTASAFGNTYIASTADVENLNVEQLSAAIASANSTDSKTSAIS